MATQLFLLRPDTNLPKGSSSTASPNTFQRSDVSAATNNGPLSTTRGSASSTSTATSTVAGPTSGVQQIWNQLAEWLSDPIGTAITISGTVTFNIWMVESSMSANAGAQVIVDVIDKFGNVKGTTIIDSEKGTELPTTIAAQNWTGTPTSTDLLRGERIRVRLYANDVGTMASGFSTQFSCNGSSAGGTGDTYVTFTENITFASWSADSHTQYFASNTASDVNPGSATEYRLWTETATSVDAITNTAAGFTSAIQTTTSGGGAALEWYTPQLAAQTINEAYFYSNDAIESNAAANAVVCFEVAICDADGTNPTVIFYACIGTELQTTNPAVWQASGAFPDTNILDGQRLRLRIYVDDLALAAMASGHTVTQPYRHTGGIGITFQTLTEYTPAAPKTPYRSDYKQLLAH